MADKYPGRGGRGGRNGSRTRAASSIKRKNNDDIQTSKAKKSIEGSMASEIREKSQGSREEEVSRNNGGDRGGSNGSRTRSASCTKRKQFEEVQSEKSQKPMEDDDSVMEDTDKDNNGLKDKASTLLAGETSNIPTTGLKSTGLETQETDHEGYESDATDKTSKRSSKYRTRISVNFFVPPSENEADQKLYIAARKWMVKMAESDNSVALLPWWDSDMGENVISSFKDIPTSLFMFKKYFQRANPNEKGGKVYTDLYLAHSKPIAEIQGDLSWWLKKEKIDIFLKEIQSEATSRLGWLLFSFSGIHIKTLTDEISIMTGVTIAGRFKPILTDKWNPDIDSKKRLKAVHLETARKDERKAKIGLKKLYGSASKSFPLGIRMRLVAEYKDVKGNINSIKKIANLRAKQTHFLAALENDSSDEILNLDIQHSTLKTSLREMIMEIQTWGETPSNLFHAVNQAWRGDKMIFSFIPSHANEAKMIVDGLIPYLKSKHGDEVLDFFSPDACLAKDDWSWDEEKKMIMNPMGKDLENIDAADNDYNFVIEMEGDEKEETTNKLLGFMPQAAVELTQNHLERVVTGLDDDSISTIGNGTVASRRWTPRTIMATPRDSPTGRSASSGLSVSEQSYSTMNSRVSQIEEKLTSLEVNITNAMNKSLEALLEKLAAQNNKPAGGKSGKND